jgi:hypothetical protein
MDAENASTSAPLEHIVSTISDVREGTRVFVVHQRPRHATEERVEWKTVVRVGRKYGYIKRFSREERFDLRTGFSTHGDCNARANRNGFDVYVSEDEYRRVQHADAERRRLQERIVDRLGRLKSDVSDDAVAAIHAILDEC